MSLPRSFVPDTPSSFRPDAQATPSVPVPKSFVPDPEPTGVEGFVRGSPLLSGLATGAGGMKESFGGSLTMAGKALGIKALEDYGETIRKAGVEDAARFLPKVTRIEDVHSTGDFADWFTYNLGQSFPSMATSTAGALAGGGIGSLVGGPVGGVRGAMLGAGGVSYMLNAGEVYSELREQGMDEPGAAAAAGIPMAVLDMIEPTHIAGRLVFKPARTAIMKRVLKEAGKGVLTEGLTEGAQEAIEAGVVVSKTGKDFMTPETISRVLNAAAAGALAGGVFGGGAEAIPGRATGRQPGGIPTPPIVETDTATTKAVGVEPIAAVPPPSFVPDPAQTAQVVEMAKQVLPEPPLPTEVQPTEPVVPNKEGRIDPPTKPETAAVTSAETPSIEGVPATPTVEPSLSQAPVEAPLSLPGEQDAYSAAREVAAPRPSSIHEAIKAKESVFHATDVEGFEGILAAGMIKPTYMDDITYQQAADKVQNPSKNIEGVSVSRVPRMASKASKAISLVIDPERMPPSRPFVETGYEKFLSQNPLKPPGTPTSPNVQYEFENRTYGEPIPLSAVKEVLVDRSVVGYDSMSLGAILRVLPPNKASQLEQLSERKRAGDKLTSAETAQLKDLTSEFETASTEARIDRIKEIAKAKGLQVFVFKSGKHMALYRAHIGARMLKERAKRNAESGVLNLEDLVPLVNSMMDKLASFAKVKPTQALVRQEDITKFGSFSKNFLTLMQIAERNPWIEPLQRYLRFTREWWTARTEVTARADATIRSWQRLKPLQAKRLTDFLFDVTHESTLLQRRLTDAELITHAEKLGLEPDAYIVWRQIDSDMRGMLEQMEQAALTDAAQTIKDDSGALAARQLEIQKQYGEMRNRNYFPFSRFGKHAVRVKAKNALTWQGKRYVKGQLVELSVFEIAKLPPGVKLLASSRDEYFEEAQRAYPSNKFDVATDTLDDSAFAFQGFPPSLFRAFENETDSKGQPLLNKDQLRTIREMYLDMSPGQSFIKHLKKRKGIKGYSTDAQRVYANYFENGANHLARLKYRWNLEVALADLNASASAIVSGRAETRRDLYFAMREHYNDVMNPGNDLAVLRGAMFMFYFAYVPKQIAVNMAQIPMMAYPYLAANYAGPGQGDLVAVRELAKAMIEVGKEFEWKTLAQSLHLTKGTPLHPEAKFSKKGMKIGEVEVEGQRLPLYSEDFQRDLMRAVQEGFIDESYATEVAGVAHGNVLRRYFPQSDLDYYFRSLTELGTLPFKVSEQYNRRVTFRAAWNMATLMRLTGDARFEYARRAVDLTMYEYARWNRIALSRGKAGALTFLFKTFLQNDIFFKTQVRGKGRAWMMALVFAGLLGPPLARDLLDLLDALGTTFKGLTGMDNPRVDLEKDARELAQAWHLDPDLMMNGIARHSFGLGKFGQMFGLPIPSMDVSPSLQAGRVIPSLKPIIDAKMGLTDFPTAFTRSAKEWLGPGGSLGMDMARSIVEDNPNGLRSIMPAAFRNIARAHEALTTGRLTDSKGNTLVNFDPHDVEHQAEILGMLMGATPTRMSEAQNMKWSFVEAQKFYIARREMMLAQYAQAIYSSEREVIADAQKALAEYNRVMPPPYRISGKELYESIRDRVKGKRAAEVGLPTRKRYLQLYEDYRKAYQQASPQGARP